ncbi:right-handed parallel beta-helix repeat-containing protein [Bacillus spongiae]|uniref:Right-handed parallel beta-helix repeat-containing protein n=1 Tax=Bacillus spongiae TaxID=2683610 RepID=A0ABU8HIL3_9BACI
MTIFRVPEDFPQVQDVIDNMMPPVLESGDTIEVSAGTFQSFVLNDMDVNLNNLERVRISGCGIGRTIFNGGGTGDGVVINGSPQTYLKNFTVQGYSGSGVLLQSNTLNGDNCVIQNVEAKFNGIGFDIQTNDNTLVNNSASSHTTGEGDGFEISGENNCLFENTSNENIAGFHVTNSNNTLVDNVAKQNTEDGFLLDGDGSNTTLVGNLALKNNIGINCQTDDNMILENRSCNNTSIGIALVGVDADIANGNRVDWNIVRGNGTMGQPNNAGIFVILGAGSTVPNAITFNKLKLNENFSILDEAGFPGTPNIYNGNVCTDNISDPVEACDTIN